MSYSPRSSLVFGVFFDESDLNVVTKVRGCKHDCDLNANFCPVCGKPVYENEVSEIAEAGSFYDTDTVAFFKSSSYNTVGILGIPLLHTEDQDTNYYVVPKPSADNIKQLKQFLVDNDITYDEDDLQVYVYTDYD